MRTSAVIAVAGFTFAIMNALLNLINALTSDGAEAAAWAATSVGWIVFGRLVILRNDVLKLRDDIRSSSIHDTTTGDNRR